MYTTLITAAQLQNLQQSGQSTLVFDCSFDLARPEAGAQMFADSHLAGAIFADLDRHLSAKGDPQQTGACSGGRAGSSGGRRGGARRWLLRHVCHHWHRPARENPQ